MPQQLPWDLFIKRGIRRIASLQATWFRALLVASVWLGALPYITVWVWRFYFWSGDKIAFMINGRMGNPQVASSSVTNVVMNASNASSYTGTVIDVNSKFIPVKLLTQYLFSGDPEKASARLLQYKAIANIVLADIFEGQIITCVVVVVFVAAFLLREWIVQNTPPEMEEPPAEGLLAAQEMPAFQQELERQRHQGVQVLPDTVPLPQAAPVPRANHPTMPNDYIPLDTADSGSLFAPSPEFPRTTSFTDPTRGSTNGAATPNTPFSSYSRTHSHASIPGAESGTAYDAKGKGNADAIIAGAGSSIAEGSGQSSTPSSSASFATTPFENEKTPTPTSSIIQDPPPQQQPIEAPEIQRPVADGLWNGVQGWFLGMWNGVLQDENVRPVREAPEDDAVHPHGMLRRPAEDAPRAEGRPRRAGVFDEGFRAADGDMDDDDEGDDEDDDEDDEAGDDLEGVMEALGMRGSLAFLFQNSALMALLIALCLGIAVYSPYMIGKTLLMANMRSVIKFPFVVIRYITDPTVDAIFDKYLPTLWKLTYTLMYPGLAPLMMLWNKVLQITWVHETADRAMAAFNSISSSAISSNTTSPSQLQTTVQTTLMGYVPPQVSQFLLDDLFKIVHDVGVGTNAADRVICILVGYAVTTLSAMLYVSRTRNIYGRTVGRALQEAIKQQGVILKVAFFVTIELVIFPIACGLLLDLSTLPLFPGATVWSRILFYVKAPVTSVFLHWFVGTAFMFHFAVFVSMCRENVRSGVMWFIRDPNDPQFHPIKEILDRPVLTQLRKIGASGIMYSAMIVIGIGTVVYFDRYVLRGLLPLRWHLDRPITDFPIDLLLCHVVVPVTISYARPKRVFRTIFTNWWKVTSRQLRLTSFMFGGRFPEEEGSHKGTGAHARFMLKKAPVGGNAGETGVTFVPDGGLAKAPSYDGIAVVPGKRILIPVNKEGHPLTQEEADAQDHPLRKPPKLVPVSDRMVASGVENIEDALNHVIVYIPPDFRQRILLFLFLMWFCGAVFSTVVIAAPLVTGRIIFAYVLRQPQQVHDLYAFAAGFYVLWGVLYSAYWLYIRQIRKTKVTKEQLSNIAIKACKAVYFLSTFGFGIPIILSWTVELYIFFPVSLKMSTDPLLHLAQSWSFGILYLKLGHKIMQMLPENRFNTVWIEVMDDGILQADVKAVTKRMVLPMVGAGLLLLLMPLGIGWSVVRGLVLTNQADQFKAYHYAYPFVLSLVAAVILARHMRTVVKKWMESVRDDEFLVGRELHNLNSVDVTSRRRSSVGANVDNVPVA